MTHRGFKQLGWFVMIWIGSVLALGVVAFVIRLAING
jgi:hypothetical protein